MFAPAAPLGQDRSAHWERQEALRRARSLRSPRLLSPAEDGAAHRPSDGAPITWDWRARAVPSGCAGGIDLRSLDRHAIRPPSGVTSCPPSCPPSCTDPSAEAGLSSVPDPPAAESGQPTGAADPLVAALALVEAAIAADAIASDGHGLVDEALSERLVTCARLVDRVRVVQALTAGPWQARGVHCGKARSAPCWLGIHTDVSRREATSLLQAASLLSEHGVVREMARDGRLRFAHVELLAHAATSDRAALFARDVQVLATHLAGARPYEASVLVRRWKMLADDALASKDAAAQHDRRRLHHSRVGNVWKTDALTDLEEGELIRKALDAATDGPDDPQNPGARTIEQRRADALVRIARHWLEHRDGGGSRSMSAAVTLHVNEAGLLGRSSEDGFDPTTVCDLVPGGPVARSTARRLLCDSAVGRAVFGARGELLDLGRRERLFTVAQRRAMIARDGPCCVVPYCDMPAERCHAHHLNPFEAGGATDLVNGALLCNGNHHDVHDRDFRLERLAVAGHYRWTAPDGRVWTTDRTAWGVHLPRAAAVPPSGNGVAR